MSDNMDVFVCYSSVNKRKADIIKCIFEKSGLSVWMAPYSIPAGGDWPSEIPPGIRKCNIFALLISESSVQSDEVYREITIAMNSKKELLPLKIEDIDLNLLNERFEYYLCNKHIVDCTKDFEINIGRIAEQICSSLHEKNLLENFNKKNESITNLTQYNDKSINADDEQLILEYDYECKILENGSIFDSIMNSSYSMHLENMNKINQLFFESALPYMQINDFDDYEIKKQVIALDRFQNESKQSLFDLENERWNFENDNLKQISDAVLNKLKADYVDRINHNNVHQNDFTPNSKILKEEYRKYFYNNKNELKIIFVVDTSGSMQLNNKIDMINQGINFVLKEKRPENISVDIISYGSEISIYNAPEKIKLSADGMTSFGTMTSFLKDYIEKTNTNRTVYCFIFIADGDSNDKNEDKIFDLLKQKWFVTSYRYSFALESFDEVKFFQLISNNVKEVTEKEVSELPENIVELYNEITINFIEVKKEYYSNNSSQISNK